MLKGKNVKNISINCSSNVLGKTETLMSDRTNKIIKRYQRNKSPPLSFEKKKISLKMDDKTVSKMANTKVKWATKSDVSRKSKISVK